MSLVDFGVSDMGSQNSKRKISATALAKFFDPFLGDHQASRRQRNRLLGMVEHLRHEKNVARFQRKRASVGGGAE
ncbi:hypothetical protein GCM10023116_16130 [Kistimonas scapharcae]|uniref:Uncharacterized protein n=1 Tax=Kistimonas scapharcae TaxID=1036133 RepID=A0ABP8V191_9GAMM